MSYTTVDNSERKAQQIHAGKMCIYNGLLLMRIEDDYLNKKTFVNEAKGLIFFVVLEQDPHVVDTSMTGSTTIGLIIYLGENETVNKVRLNKELEVIFEK